MPKNSLPEILSDEISTSPFFRNLNREMNQFFDRVRQQVPTSVSESFEASGGPLMPALDIVETDEAIEITAEIPGVKESDLDVSIANNVLTLKGEKSSDHEEKEDTDHLVERRYGNLRRSIPLGFTPHEDAVVAKFADGVLKLRIAKPAEAKASVRKIKIGK